MNELRTAREPEPLAARPLPSLLVFADDWGRHPSSCQHLIRRLRDHTTVLWVNTIGTRQVRADSFTLRRGIEKLRNWGKGLHQVAETMWVLDVPMVPGLGHFALRGLNRVLVSSWIRQSLSHLGMTRPAILTTLPYIHWLIRDLPRRALIYYCTDDYSHWPSADQAVLQQADRELGQEADLILAASRALDQHHAPTGKSSYFPHGVDFEHFASAQNGLIVPQIVANLARPRIGFFGLIYEKLDFELLTSVARRFPDASLVLVGPVASCPPEIRQIPNVVFLGPQPYETLPQIIAGLDVLLLPYVNDEMIRQSGPLKLRECLASGKPTVGIDIPDLRACQPHVRIGGTRDEFLAQIQDALREPRGAPESGARQQAVKADGWDRRADELCRHLIALDDSNRSACRANETSVRPTRRILHLRTVTGKGGGPEKTILNSPRFLAGEYDMRLLYIRPVADEAYEMVERAQKLGVDLADIPERGPLDPRTIWRLVHEIRTYRPSLLHAHDYKTNLLSVLLGRWFHVPVVTTLHGYGLPSGRMKLYCRLDAWTLPRMDHVIAVSDDLFAMLENLRIPRERRSLIANAIDTQEYSRRLSQDAAKLRLGLARERFVVGAVGRLSVEKAFDLLITSFDQLLTNGIDGELYIVGDGDEKERLAALIARLGRVDRIHLVGHQSQTREWYEAMDVLVLSSLREGLPNVLLEAMALEVPVVATRVGGVPRLIQDDRNGVLIEAGSVESLAQGMARLLADRDLRARLAAAGRQTVVEHHSFAARMQKIRAVYDRVLGGPVRLNPTVPPAVVPNLA